MWLATENGRKVEEFEDTNGYVGTGKYLFQNIENTPYEGEI